MTRPPRIWISNRTPTIGETLHVRSMITHPMDAGLRHGDHGGALTRNIVNHVTCHLDHELIFEWFPQTAVSQNPYLEFRFVIRRAGVLRLRWVDDAGQVVEIAEPLVLG